MKDFKILNNFIKDYFQKINSYNQEDMDYEEQITCFKIIFNKEPTKKIKLMKSNQIELVNEFGKQGLSLDECILRSKLKQFNFRRVI